MGKNEEIYWRDVSVKYPSVGLPSVTFPVVGFPISV